MGIGLDKNTSPSRDATNELKLACSIISTFTSNMEVFQDDFCLILDLEGFFVNETFHFRELAYCTWNGEHGHHAFLIPVPYKTLSNKDKPTVNFVR